MTTFPFQLPNNVTVIPEEDRTLDGSYAIGGGQMFSFEFDIPADGQIKIVCQQFDGQRQSLSIKAWVSTDPADRELFDSFHPGSGGIHHLLADETLEPLPEPEVFQIQRNEFSSFEFAVAEILVPLPAGPYHYNVLNMEGLENGFKLNLAIPVLL